LILEDTYVENHGNLVSPFPNAPTIWRYLFEIKDPLINKHENDKFPSLDASPIHDEATLQNIVM
jgi:hypothetical protein